MEPVKQRAPIVDIPGDDSLADRPGPNSVSIGTNSHTDYSTDYSDPPVISGSTGGSSVKDFKNKKLSRGEFLTYGLGGLLTLTGVGAIYEAVKGENSLNLAKNNLAPKYSGLLANIGDVTINNPGNGDILSYNTMYKAWVNSPQYLKNNTDVSILSPKNKQVLSYDAVSNKWTNQTPNLSFNSDVALSSPTDSEVLTYDQTTGAWTNKSLPAGIVPPVSSVNNQTGAVDITAAGIGALAAANDLSDLTNAGTARTNLGLGSAATENVGSANGVASLDSTGNVPTTQLNNVPANVRYRGAWAATRPMPSTMQSATMAASMYVPQPIPQVHPSQVLTGLSSVRLMGLMYPLASPISIAPLMATTSRTQSTPFRVVVGACGSTSRPIRSRPASQPACRTLS